MGTTVAVSAFNCKLHRRRAFYSTAVVSRSAVRCTHVRNASSLWEVAAALLAEVGGGSFGGGMGGRAAAAGVKCAVALVLPTILVHEHTPLAPAAVVTAKNLLLLQPSILTIPVPHFV